MLGLISLPLFKQIARIVHDVCTWAQLACSASILHGTCVKVALCLSSLLAVHSLSFSSLAMLCEYPRGCLPCNCYFPVPPGSTSTPAAQLVDHSDLVRAAALALAAPGGVADPKALSTAAAALAHLGALPVLTLSALPRCSSLPART